MALEEGVEEDEAPLDLEGNLAPRPAHRVHAFKISFAIMLVILTQALGVSRVSANFYFFFIFLGFKLTAL